jgi:hypothetical protein
MGALTTLTASLMGNSITTASAGCGIISSAHSSVDMTSWKRYMEMGKPSLSRYCQVQTGVGFQQVRCEGKESRQILQKAHPSAHLSHTSFITSGLLSSGSQFFFPPGSVMVCCAARRQGRHA